MQLVKTASAFTAGIAVAATAAFLLADLRQSAGPRPAAAAPAGPNAGLPVPTAAVVRRTVPVYLDYVGRTEAIRSVTLQAKVSGYLVERGAPDGADVQQGDLIYRIDPRDYQAALDQTKAQAARDAAALAYARVNLERGDKLAKDGWVAKDNYDQRASTLHQAEATLAADRAAIQTAELALGYTEIRAPFAGRLSRSQVHEGALVSTSGAGAGTALNTLVQLDPIYVTFNPGETDLAAIEQARARGAVPAEVMLAGDTQARLRGTVSFLDNAVDRTTGTITARATIANADRSLLPGQYVRVRLHIGDRPDTLLVPQVALGSSQLGKYVYVVGPDSKAERRLIAPGASYGELVAVSNGVREGEQVITGNLQKFGPGAPVKPNPAQVADTR